MSANLSPIRRALISVSDKAGLIDRARKLVDMGVELVSTGGTSKAIADAGLPVKDVSELTGFPEMMDGRVKTLHPVVHGGLLYRRDFDTHVQAANEHNIGAIDLLYVNLYPFEATVAAGKGFEDCIENIDIGGPAMLRAAAKNADFVAVCTDGVDVDKVITDMEANNGATTLKTRRALSAKTYARTAAYDAAISNWYVAQIEAEALADKEKIKAPALRAFGGQLKQELRYGENPHQKAAVYTSPDSRPGVLSAQQVQGKELSFNNLNDTNSAYELVAEFDPADRPAVAIIKHANPCGVAVGETSLEAYKAALACDPVSAFGGIVALNCPLDAPTAEAITQVFTEVVIAPGASEEAIAVFSKKKNLRLLLTDALPDPKAPSLDFRSIAGGMLVQERDTGRIELEDLKVVTERAPTEQEMKDMLFAWRVAKHVKSNCIVYAKDDSTAGLGMGLVSRVDSARLATIKAQDAAKAAGWSEPRTKGCAAASEAFIPFADGLLQAIEAGATSFIQPGGSVRDEEVIAAANKAGVAMVFTGMRHFKH
ncbi:bifunctional phosphoribosylaminoimidazolecarboxamide formyltransferase/IMP cyclohydrolase [Hirschia litorea]|uniref:Bifunctional purine biosynthesis protein PurH n=1 Tax=Hirschia litorea TaxID=1199156 RepID=A0ABW2INB9_9PROT